MEGMENKSADSYENILSIQPSRKCQIYQKLFLLTIFSLIYSF